MPSVSYKAVVSGPQEMDREQAVEVLFDVRWTGEAEYVLQIQPHKAMFEVAGLTITLTLPGCPKLNLRGSVIECLSAAQALCKMILEHLTLRIKERRAEVEQAKVRQQHELWLSQIKAAQEKEVQEKQNQEHKLRMDKLRKQLEDHPYGDTILRFKNLELD